MRKVVINGKEYAMRYTLRSLFIYEQITGKAYSGATLSDSYLLMYATLCACNKEIDWDFDMLIDACDDDPSIFHEFCNMLNDEAKRVSIINDDSEKKKMKQ